MKLLYLACTATILLSIFAFFQSQTIRQLHDQVSEGEQYSKALSAGLDKSANDRLELMRQLAALEEQLLDVAHTSATTNVESSITDDLEPDGVEEETSQKRDRTFVGNDGSTVLMLNIPPRIGARMETNRTVKSYY